MKKSVIVIAVILLVIIAGVYYNFRTQTSDIGETQNQYQEQDTKPSTEQTQETTTPNNQEQTEQSSSYDIEIKGFAYSPETLIIKVGDKVTWTNYDYARHTVTSDSGGELDSALLSKGESYTHTFETAGTYDYYCKPHPYMTAKIIVE